MKIISVVGARPNFMKIAPFIKAIQDYNSFTPSPGLLLTESDHHPITQILVHTGQHYDKRMSDSFFKALDIPEPDLNLGIGSGTHAEQVGQTMIEFEKVLQREKPDWVVVVGDVNATLACSVTAKKEKIKCCHIEAGLRSGDITMPEEVNRLVTDRLCDLLLTPDLLSCENLRKEGVRDESIRFVGNIMIDTLEANRTKALALTIDSILKENILSSVPSAFCLPPSAFVLITLHRPSNVDRPEVLSPIIDFIISDVASDIPVIWPLHPRTEKQLKHFGLFDKLISHKDIILLHPLGYHEMLKLNMSARLMLTDSGGLQEECTVLGTPCLTLRWNTERPVTLRENGGVSVLVGNNIERIKQEYHHTLSLKVKPQRPELWDGKTAERCLRAILDFE